MLATLHLAALVALAAAAAWTDARTARIPNALTVTGLLAGLALGAAGGTLGSSALAAALAFGLGFVLFATGVLGGGDVKLLVATAALLGVGRLPEALLLTALAGAALAVLVAVRRGVLFPALLNSKDMLLSWATPVREAPRGAVTAGVGIPYGVAIAVGTVAAWFL
jgi:prepilin peptidase CpaA